MVDEHLFPGPPTTEQQRAAENKAGAAGGQRESHTAGGHRIGVGEHGGRLPRRDGIYNDQGAGLRLSASSSFVELPLLLRHNHPGPKRREPAATLGTQQLAGTPGRGNGFRQEGFGGTDGAGEAAQGQDRRPETANQGYAQAPGLGGDGGFGPGGDGDLELDLRIIRERFAHLLDAPRGEEQAHVARTTTPEPDYYAPDPYYTPKYPVWRAW